MAKLSYSYDEETDMMTIQGINYSGQYFRDMALFSGGEKFEVLATGRWGSGRVVQLKRLLTPRALDAAIALKNWLVRLFTPRQ
jgi:hypothetical protein